MLLSDGFILLFIFVGTGKAEEVPVLFIWTLEMTSFDVLVAK